MDVGKILNEILNLTFLRTYKISRSLIVLINFVTYFFILNCTQSLFIVLFIDYDR